jgi:hypothetical protein
VVFDPDVPDTGPLEERISELEGQVAVLQAQVSAIAVSNIAGGSNWRYSGDTNTWQITDGSGNWYTPTYDDGGITLTPA